MASPFNTHRAKVLGHYSTASWLRRAVMAMWNGTAHPVGLSNLTNLDAEHFDAFVAMVTHYRKVGEGDPDLHRLVKDIEERLAAEAAAEDQARRYEPWSAEARQALRRLGKDVGLMDDRYTWFEGRFLAGDTPVEAASNVQPLAPLND